MELLVLLTRKKHKVITARDQSEFAVVWEKITMDLQIYLCYIGWILLVNIRRGEYLIRIILMFFFVVFFLLLLFLFFFFFFFFFFTNNIFISWYRQRSVRILCYLKKITLDQQIYLCYICLYKERWVFNFYYFYVCALFLAYYNAFFICHKIFIV